MIAELGYELWVDADRALELWDAVVAAGDGRWRAIGRIDARVSAIAGH